MSELSVFSFSEKLPVRVVEINAEPWFVARDIAQCLEYSKSTINSIVKLVESVPDQWKGMQEFETNGGKQKLLALSEQGLYFFLGRSDKPKALPFQMWLAGEVLPQIRKHGYYDAHQPEYISEAQQREIQRAVGRKAAATRSFAVVYRALKDHFQIPRYTCLLAKDFDAAIAFINALDIKAIEPPQPEPETALPPPQLSDEDMESLLIFVFMVRYFFADAFNKFYALLKCTNSPLAGQCWDAFHEVNWFRIIDVLAANGHDINDLPSFQRWKARRAA